jgi:2-C-methyl-D-erythritol 2,4-cyclodiphosphate synthase
MSQVSTNKGFNFRTGFGVDIHQLVEGRKLIIGGIQIPSSFGALGHSDADVLAHAICDALLGAANLRDIGFHFPDTDSCFENVDSMILLAKCIHLVRDKKYEISNLDCTVLLEAPKLSAFIPSMQTRIAEVLNIEADQISIKATRGEKIGFIGRGEGIKAYCTILIYKS